MAINSAQKFIARNRAPRVQIEYDVEIYGSEKNRAGFRDGGAGRLAGKPREELPPVTDLKFLDIDIDTSMSAHVSHCAARGVRCNAEYADG